MREMKTMKEMNAVCGSNEVLWRLYSITKDIKYRNILIEKNIPLVSYIVNRMFQRGCKYLEFEDMIGYGNLGLIHAIDKFKPNAGAKFSTFACNKIQYYIIDELRKLDWVPRSIRFKINKAKRDILQLENQLGCHVDLYTVTKSYGLTEKDINVMNGTVFTPIENIYTYGDVSTGGYV